MLDTSTSAKRPGLTTLCSLSSVSTRADMNARAASAGAAPDSSASSDGYRKKARRAAGGYGTARPTDGLDCTSEAAEVTRVGRITVPAAGVVEVFFVNALELSELSLKLHPCSHENMTSSGNLSPITGAATAVHGSKSPSARWTCTSTSNSAMQQAALSGAGMRRNDPALVGRAIRGFAATQNEVAHRVAIAGARPPADLLPSSSHGTRVRRCWELFIGAHACLQCMLQLYRSVPGRAHPGVDEPITP